MFDELLDKLTMSILPTFLTMTVAFNGGFISLL